MKNGVDIQIDTEQVRKMFRDLTGPDKKKALKRAVRGGLNILKKKSIINLQSVISGDINKKSKFGTSLRSGIKTKVFRSGYTGMIHLRGDYRLKFFELGTVARYNKTLKGKALKKPRFTGQIHATHFFKSACKESEQELLQSMDRLITQSIQKIANKYK